MRRDGCAVEKREQATNKCDQLQGSTRCEVRKAGYGSGSGHAGQGRARQGKARPCTYCGRYVEQGWTGVGKVG